MHLSAIFLFFFSDTIHRRRAPKILTILQFTQFTGFEGITGEAEEIRKEHVTETIHLKSYMERTISNYSPKWK